MSVKQLYQQVIMKHFKDPSGFGSIPEACDALSRENSLCGDSFKLTATVDGVGRIQSLTIEGTGCAISVAACSMMTEKVRGCTLPEAFELAVAFLNELPATEPLNSEQWGELAALESVRRHPSRISCALFCWKMLHDYLQVRLEKPAVGDA